jgi:putative ABC transport system ATP-binding protein
MVALSPSARTAGLPDEARFPGEKSMAIIEIKDVTKCYDTGSSRVRALQGFSLSIQPGEAIIFSGKSGCGKTTLLNLVGGLDKPTSGEIWVGQRNIGALSEKERTLYRRREVGTIFQSFNLIPMLSVEENIALPHWLEGFSTEQTRRRVDTLLDQLNLTPRRNHRPYELSGGEQQRVAIARALINSPRVILADEPTGNLDSQTGYQVLSILSDLNRNRGQTILIATHSREADSLANRIITLKDGQILEIRGCQR